MGKNSNTPIELYPAFGRHTAEALKRLGVYTVGQFVQIPIGLLEALFGPSIRKVYLQTLKS